MTQGEYQPVRVSRRIAAPAEEIFRILADPARHLDLDGSGMLRGAATSAVISGVGDVFVMKMFHAPFGDYQMDNHVVEYEPNRRIGWEPAAGKGHPAASDDDRDNHDDGDGRWGHRWSYELTPDGPGATIVTEIYDCSRAPEEARNKGQTMRRSRCAADNSSFPAVPRLAWNPAWPAWVSSAACA
jgi:uncharacterized protein YndB with AHSA1/START domain